MDYIVIMLGIMLGFVLVTEFVMNIVNAKAESTLLGGFVSAGVSLIISSFPSTLNDLMNLFGKSLGNQWAVETVNLWSLSSGIVLIVLGIIVDFQVKDRIFIINMFGLYSQIEISDKKHIKDLHLSDFKVKEIIIDFVDVFKNGVNETTNKIITSKVEKECLKFKERSKEFKSCFTGMAPIPYTILAGTYLSDSGVERYFEYKRSENTYYEITNRIKKNKFESLDVKYPINPSVKATDVVVAISITKRISKTQLSDFENMDVIEIYLPNPGDNVINLKKQLNQYKMTILNCLEELGTQYSKLEKIHMVASIPSCMSVEIGKMISLNNNRLKQIIAYHYEAQGIKKYPFGIVVTENTSNNEKGKLVKR